MWNWDYEEEGTNIREGVRGTVTGGCSKGICLRRWTRGFRSLWRIKSWNNCVVYCIKEGY